ncbi:MAG: glutathione S-transferase family protein [Congregibacter sp.]|nr:glutathione S-transferase family protein [Congregibacter sp.]
MADTMILHHYESSPYAEKIRLMFGFTNSKWCSLIAPAWPPRPSVDPLSGGYRRIPIAQLGADIFCDSSLIAREIAGATKQASLDPAGVTGPALELMQRAEGDGFFSAITSLPAHKLLGTMLRNFGPLGAYRFVKDRKDLLKGGTSRPKAAGDARAVMRDLFATLDSLLKAQPWVGGDSPSVADFAVYHPIWLHLRCHGNLPSTAKYVHRWYRELGEFGHGQRHEITQAEAFEQARSAAPRSLPTNQEPGDLSIGEVVTVQPEDYGLVAVSGSLAAITTDRIILARETKAFGILHVHFPRSGYALNSVNPAKG